MCQKEIMEDTKGLVAMFLFSFLLFFLFYFFFFFGIMYDYTIIV